MEKHVYHEETVTPTGGANIHHDKHEDGGAMKNIKEGVKEGVENVKEGMHKLANKVTGNDDDSAKAHAKEAKHLGKKAEDCLDDAPKDFKKAEKAQHKADKEAVKANEKTAKALNKHEKGQEYLAEAGKPSE